MAVGRALASSAAGDGQLLAVLKFCKSSKMYCQRPGCGSPLHAKGFWVQISGTFMLLGSDCFCALFGHEWGLGRPVYMPEYRPSDGARIVNIFERERFLKHPASFAEELRQEHLRTQRRNAYRGVWAQTPKQMQIGLMAVALARLAGSKPQIS
jgi:hypothetical protein